MYGKILILCFISLTAMFTVNASSYQNCTDAEKCKDQMRYDFSFEYVTSLNRFTREKLQIVQDAAVDSQIMFMSDPTKFQKLNEIMQAAHDGQQAVKYPHNFDLKKSRIAFENADHLWKTLFELIGEDENLRYYENLMEVKIVFLNSIYRIWKSTVRLMLVKTENDAAEIEEITKELKDFDPILSFRGTETPMAKLIERIFKFLQLDA